MTTIEIVDIVLSFFLLVVAALTLTSLLKTNRTAQLEPLKRGIFLMFALIILELVEDTIEFVYLAEEVDPDSITLEILILALIATALYYAHKVKRLKSKEPLGTATICTVWLVVAYTIESIMGLLIAILF